MARAPCVSSATSAGSCSRPATASNTGGSSTTICTAVTDAASRYANRRRARKLGSSSTSAVAALISMKTGDSMMIAKAKATPNAARLVRASGRRAMMAARYGPSAAIISQVPASGSQKVRMPR